jgi:hypothetical protein
MTIFKDHNISVKQLLGFIPQALITNLSLTNQDRLLREGSAR